MTDCTTEEGMFSGITRGTPSKGFMHEDRTRLCRRRMVFSVSRETSSQVLYWLLQHITLTPGSASSEKNHCCRVRQPKAPFQLCDSGMHLSITATSTRKEQLIEKVDTLEGHFCSAIACNLKQCHIFILATMQKMIRCRGPVSLLQQLGGNCQTLRHTLPGTDLLLPQHVCNLSHNMVENGAGQKIK